MPKEIKFRAWDECAEAFWFTDDNNGQESCKCLVVNGIVMFEYETYEPYQAMGEVIDSYSTECFEPKPKHINQYVGLKDKGGKPIFEDDIVKAKKSNSGLGGQDDLYQIVFDNKFSQYCFKIISSSNKNRIGHLCTKSNGQPYLLSNVVEIIGNIYENPELLTPTNDN